MDQATKKQADRPAKPRPDFPLFPHATGRWAKKVRGKLHYFGKVADDPRGTAALERWLDQKDDLLAGRTPRKVSAGVSVADLCNSFLHFKRGLMDAGELSPRTWAQYLEVSELIIATFGRNRPAADILPDDFQRLRGVMAKRWGPVRLGNQIQSTRSLFKYGWEAGLLAAPVRFGPGFKKPSAKVLRQVRTANGPKLFTPEQIKSLLKHSPAHVKAMILLAINGGLGNTDLGMLPEAAIDLEGGWLDYPRAKTAMPRRIPLWPETVKALKEAISKRPAPKNPDDAGLVFIGPRGQNFVGNHKGFRVTAAFDKAAKAAGIEGRTFYDLRRTFQTIGEGAHDLVAIQSIMGHAPASGDMSAIYRQRVDDARLKAVTDHVREWLYGATSTERVEG